MGTKFNYVKVLEHERDQSEVLGKGRTGNDLVYFQLDGTYLRQLVRKGSVITVTADELIGLAEGYFS